MAVVGFIDEFRVELRGQVEQLAANLPTESLHSSTVPEISD